MIAMETPVVVTLQREELDAMMEKAALVGAQVAADALKAAYTEMDLEKKNRRLHNTRLLLNHYQEFKAHCTEASFESRHMVSEDEFITHLMQQRDDGMVLESIRRTVERTGMIVAHIDRMVSVFKSFCDRGGQREKRQYEVLRAYYLSPEKMTVQQLSEMYSVSRRAIYKDLRSGEEKLAVLIFGMDGLSFAVR